MSPRDSNQGNEDRESVLRLQRKRSRDRHSQRQARERTKTRLAFLESLVKEMTDQEASGNTATLLQEFTEVKQQRDQLAKAFEAVAKIMSANQLPALQPTPLSIESVAGGTQETLQITCTAAPSADDVSSHTEDSLFHDGHLLESGGLQPQFTGSQSILMEPTASESVGLDPLYFSQEDAATLATIDASAGALAHHENPSPGSSLWEQVSLDPPCQTTCECYDTRPGSRHNGEKSMWRRANEKLADTYGLDPSLHWTLDNIDEDLPVRAVLDGWDSAANFWGMETLPPLWQILRGVDEILFAHDSGKVERLAILKLLYLRLVFLREPCLERLQKIPPWYNRRYARAFCAQTPSRLRCD